MLRYLLTRAFTTFLTLVLVGVVVFALVRLVPGDPVQVMLGEGADAASVERLRESLGLNQSIPSQFLAWSSQVLRGDLGESISTGESVLPLILDRFAVSGPIVLVAVLIAILIAVPAGVLAAWRHNSALDMLAVVAATIAISMPSFWLGLLLLLLFGLKLGWLPVVGYVSMSEDLVASLAYLVLPIATLALIEAGALTRMMRATTLEVLGLDYVTHARAKGLPESRVLFRHVLPNAFAPTWTLVGLILGHLLGGIAVLETVFTLPGLGRLLVDGIYARDYPVVQGCLLFTAAVYVFINLLVDLVYPVFDPRVAAE